MKRSSSTSDQNFTNNYNEISQGPYAKVVRPSANQSRFNSTEISMDPSVGDKTLSWSPRYSTILGSFAHPPTYVIHTLDSHLTFLQSFQICSLFGQVRIHGHNLQPLKYYSIYNYRVNSPLSIEYIPSPSLSKSLQQIKFLIPDHQLAENVLLTVEKKGGDILLIRNEPTNDSIFIRTIREHRMYKNWFLETYPIFLEDKWRELEKNLQIRLIETTDRTVIIPRQEFISTVDHVINQWLTKTTENFPFVVLICGEKDLGKSTFTRYLINRSLNHINPIYDLTYFDCDIGQCEFTIGGCLSYIKLDTPLFGPPCSHIKSNPKPNRLLYYGLVSPQTSPVRYLQYIDKLRQLWNIDQKVDNLKRSMIIINTMGWGTGLGLELLKETICMCCPNIIIQLDDNSKSTENRNKMPDVTLPWLLQEPVFSPYRRQVQMNDRRQQDYDGQLNYEYIKIQSAAATSSSNTSHSNNPPKLRARDHRLLATWSYFFSSNLSRIQLPYSQFVHVSLSDIPNKNFNELPKCLEHSIVAFCSIRNVDRIRNSAIYINGMFHTTDDQKEIFECLGFGWIERCDNQSQTYEIYTPINNLSNVNSLVSGSFDIPEEFEYMFKRIAV